MKGRREQTDAPPRGGHHSKGSLLPGTSWPTGRSLRVRGTPPSLHQEAPTSEGCLHPLLRLSPSRTPAADGAPGAGKEGPQLEVTPSVSSDLAQRVSA